MGEGSRGSAGRQVRQEGLPSAGWGWQAFVPIVSLVSGGSLVGPARRHLSPLSRLSRWVLWRAQLGDPCPVPMSQEFL